MKKWLISLLVAASLSAPAQVFEAGVFVGLSNYEGDLADVAFTFKEFHPSLGAMVKFNMIRFFSLKASVNYGRISGSDANSSKDYLRRRNLSFRSPIYEAALTGEINILGYKLKDKGFRITPYLTGGIAIFHFKPETLYQSGWVELQPVGTEGQNLADYSARKYDLTQWSVPVGGGIKYKASDQIHLALEWVLRKTFTDYLDDVSTDFVDPQLLAESGDPMAAFLSDRAPEVLGYTPFSDGDQRGDPTDKDWYMFTGMSITFSLQRANPKSAGGGIRCFGF